MAAVARAWWRLSHPALGATLLGTSFRPWFARTIDGTAVFPLAHQVDAWRGSTLWTFVVPPLHGVVTFSVSPREVADPYRIERNQLASYASANGLGQRVWITGWSYLGLAAVAVLLAALVVQLTICVRQSQTNTASLPSA